VSITPGDAGVGGGEERVESPGVEQRGLAVAFGPGLGVEVGDPAHDQAAGHLIGLLLRSERGERCLGDLSA
jgi:hypothetical protein